MLENMNTFTVSQLTEQIKRNLESAFSAIQVEGELSNCHVSGAGHCYFTLKDAHAVLQAVMFKNRFKHIAFEARDGMLLRARGNLTVYGQRGNYQLVCDELELAGAGDILALIEKRKRAFAEEGLFDQERKKPLPRFPETVAVVSSPTGAALRDILSVLRRRAPHIRVVILPAPVQGASAAPALARRLEQANQWKLGDVIILGRGGGSIEDLLPFSEDAVVRAVAASDIPVISAVGHEIDYALCDFAADQRAPTPSAAAELASASQEEMYSLIQKGANTLYRTLKGRLEKARLLTRAFGAEDMEYRFRAILQPRLVRFDDAKEALVQSARERLSNLRRRLDRAMLNLEGASPCSIMERGFSVVTLERTGEVVRDSEGVQTGDRLIIRPLRGVIAAITERAEQEKPEGPCV
ncbi:MAG: exodeoxyribonuclease VII large subunit [Spirochaetaceae bacterium]|jgi:exodeoxyribonuclease VII large subunit|nr:exodeoxyribonuclease VII large subunit [Spirochaetaceae bacterium]